MKDNLTELVFILDQSGSMFPLKDDTIGGFNSMIEKQKKEPGEALVSAVLFDTDRKVLYDRVPVSEIRYMSTEDYQPGGCTALADAIGESIHHISTVHRYAREEDVPARTLFVIMTDGLENASRRYTPNQISKMIIRKKKEQNWEFLFLGADMDAVEAAAEYGIEADYAASTQGTSEGVRLNYDVVCEAVTELRKNRPLCSSEGSWKERLHQNLEPLEEAEPDKKKK